MNRWLGMDSSIRRFGFAAMVLDGHEARIVALGNITTKIDPDAPKMVDRARRIADLGKNLITLIEAQRPEYVFIESLALGMKTSRSTAQTLGRVRGLVEGICISRGLPMSEIRPDVLKHAITGHRDASKEQVASSLAKIYPLKMVADANEDETDALAVAHVGWARGGASGALVTSGTKSFRDDEDLGF